MPKPKKNESKQGFLNRCTRELIEKEDMESDQAYAVCNSYWDKSANARASVSLSLPMDLAKDEKEKRTFKITAYTGQIINRGWFDVIIDVSGMKAKNSIPILREHQRDRVVGHSKKAWAENFEYYVSGEISNATRDGREVAALADEGFPWQASVGIFGRRIEVLEDDKATAEVNGKQVTGPMDIWRESLVGEVSFVALGADDNTAAIVLDNREETLPAEFIYQQQKKEDEKMEITLEMLEKEASELLAQIREQARKEVTFESFQEETSQIKAEAGEAERTRVLGLFKQVYGDEMGEKFSQIVKPDADISDMMAFAKEKAKADVLAKMVKESPESLGAGEDPENETANLQGEEKWKAEFSKSRDLQTEFGNVERYLAFKEAESEGRVRILKSKEA